MLLTVDIETIPSQKPEALAEVRASLKPPATLKKAESIAAWWENDAEAAATEQWKKQSLDGGTMGEIISIACVNDQGQRWVDCRHQAHSERALLQAFIEQVQAWEKEEAARLVPSHSLNFPLDAHYLVAHNASFDLPFLWRRCIVNRVEVPRWLPGPDARSPREYGCTMLAWAGWGGRVSLDNLCKALGVDSPKGDLDGSMVFDAWKAGEYDRIEAYNLADALATAECWHILQGKGRI